MSILNKMHQELQDSSADSPVLATIPGEKNKQKTLLVGLVALLLTSSLALSYLIYQQQDEQANVSEAEATEQNLVVDSKAQVEQQDPVAAIAPTTVQEVASVEQVKLANDESVIVEHTLVSREPSEAIVSVEASTIDKRDDTNKALVVAEPVIDKQPLPAPVTKTVKVNPPPSDTPVYSDKTLQQAAPKKASAPKVEMTESKKTSHLSITKSTLTDAELANIHLKKAQQALQKGDNALAAQEKRKALNIKPDLHEVRKKLALYYYSVGEESQAGNLLQRGALQFPDYSDFHLMLSRIALKNGEEQKAYLYLHQHPPEVAGHIDYHASYAILAQKFKKYEQAEQLYQGILKHRPNNGRWLMSLAIAQDKQGKERLAVENYQKALLQIDLSSNAKKYINQRLTYLANQ